MNVKKTAIWAGAALLIFFLISQPQQSAGLVTSILDELRGAAEAVITFVGAVFL